MANLSIASPFCFQMCVNYYFFFFCESLNKDSKLKCLLFLLCCFVSSSFYLFGNLDRSPRNFVREFNKSTRFASSINLCSFFVYEEFIFDY